ncbi:hypothetical protein [Microbacterium sp. 71-23]|uniref:hypothetical protein n=1 Tax=Microbacterium sp. 71-23 TaxID=1895787 RepID=UPI00257F7C58|nr:hypothetical protein [Microbacterium sp. 71-23]
MTRDIGSLNVALGATARGGCGVDALSLAPGESGSDSISTGSVDSLEGTIGATARGGGCGVDALSLAPGESGSDSISTGRVDSLTHTLATGGDTARVLCGDCGDCGVGALSHTAGESGV